MANKENMRKFVTALRSGKYRQGFRALADKKDDQYEYCCLGVACEVAIENGVPLKRRVIEGSVWYDQSCSFLPTKVRAWLGLSQRTYNPLIELLEEQLPHLDNPAPASHVNDSKRVSFAEIADAFERTYLNDPE